MVLGEVGEHGAGETATRNSLLVEGMGADLDGADAGPRRGGLG